MVLDGLKRSILIEGPERVAPHVRDFLLRHSPARQDEGPAAGGTGGSRAIFGHDTVARAYYVKGITEDRVAT